MLRITLLLVVVAACGGSSSSSPSTPAPAPVAGPRTAAELGPMCDRYYVRQRTCATEYLGALLDVRVEYDMPKGTADHVRQTSRDATLAEVRVEWERDATPAVTAKICQAMVDRTPPAHVERLLKQGEVCEATTDCAAFAKCAVHTEREYIRSGAMH